MAPLPPNPAPRPLDHAKSNSLSVKFPITDFNYQSFEREVETLLRGRCTVFESEPSVCGIGLNLEQLRDKVLREADAGPDDQREEEPEIVAQALENAEVKTALEDGTIKRYLCPILKSLSADLFDIAKVGTPILVSLSLAGVISLSLSPVVFVGLFTVIARMGVAAYCANCDEGSTKADKPGK